MQLDGNARASRSVCGISSLAAGASVDARLGGNYNHCCGYGADEARLQEVSDRVTASGDCAHANNKPQRWSELANETGKRYFCSKCSSEFIVTRGGEGTIKCCDAPMTKKP